ncbi:MAG: hypothetical protein ABJL67_09855 [Sulfitobacter sp.]
MDDSKNITSARRAQIFSLLHQSEQSKRPAAKAKAAMERYLDDNTADQILSQCRASLAPIKQDERKTTRRATFFGKRLPD